MTRQPSRRSTARLRLLRSPNDNELPAPILLLAAVDRAVRHEPWWRRSVVDRPRSENDHATTALAVGDHLGYPRNSQLRSEVRARLEELVQDGLLRASRRSSRQVWSLTEAGKKLVARHRRRAWAALPESPQHRAWREAAEIAEQQIGPIHNRAREAMDAAAVLLRADVQDHVAWTTLADRLQDVLWQLGGATYCLFEWAEPDDIRPDVDDRPGSLTLRNPANWSLPDPLAARPD